MIRGRRSRLLVALVMLPLIGLMAMRAAAAATYVPPAERHAACETPTLDDDHAWVLESCCATEDSDPPPRFRKATLVGNPPAATTTVVTSRVPPPPPIGLLTAPQQRADRPLHLRLHLWKRVLLR